MDHGWCVKHGNCILILGLHVSQSDRATTSGLRGRIVNLKVASFLFIIISGKTDLQCNPPKPVESPIRCLLTHHSSEAYSDSIERAPVAERSVVPIHNHLWLETCNEYCPRCFGQDSRSHGQLGCCQSSTPVISLSSFPSRYVSFCSAYQINVPRNPFSALILDFSHSHSPWGGGCFSSSISLVFFFLFPFSLSTTLGTVKGEVKTGPLLSLSPPLYVLFCIA